MEITEILNRSKMAREFYFENQNLDDQELLKNLEAILKIEERKKESLILEKILDEYEELFNLTPTEILERIDGKNEREIRFDFEELKSEYGNYGRVAYNSKTDKEGQFKIDLKNSSGRNSLKDSFSDRGRGFNL